MHPHGDGFPEGGGLWDLWDAGGVRSGGVSPPERGNWDA